MQKWRISRCRQELVRESTLRKPFASVAYLAVLEMTLVTVARVKTLSIMRVRF